jgi:hypothetical protein
MSQLSQWNGINRKRSTRWQHLSRLKASAFFSSLQKIFSCYKTQQLILGTGIAIWWLTEPHSFALVTFFLLIRAVIALAKAIATGHAPQSPTIADMPAWVTLDKYKNCKMIIAPYDVTLARNEVLGVQKLA